MKILLYVIIQSVVTVLLTGCVAIPGETPTEQIESMEKLHADTLDKLYREHPEAREQIQKSAGYVIMDNSVVKIPMIGAGSGYGIAINRIKMTQSYVKMLRLDIGWGGGARHVRPVLIMYDQKEFESFVKGKWIFNSGGEAAVKAGDTGSAGRASSDELGTDKTYDFYLLTEEGVSATFTAAVIHVRDVKLEE